MRVLVFSDIHFNHHADGGDSFLAWVKKEAGAVDAVVVAGDITASPYLKCAVEMLAANFLEVIFTLGNHDYYGNIPSRVFGIAARIERTFSNVHWLEIDRKPFTLNGVRFLGGTLWFPDPGAKAPKQYFPDFKHITEFEPWVYDMHKKTIDWLCDNIKSEDIVVTHHAPSDKSVSPGYENHPMGVFFHSPLDKLIETYAPRIWIHGHMHSRRDYIIGKTRILCNPLGYVNIGENSGFDPALVLEL